MAKLAKRFRLYLADTLSCYVKLHADLFKRMATAVFKSETQSYDRLFTRSKGMKHVIDILVGYGLERRLVGSESVLILNEIHKAGVLLRSYGRFH